MPTKQYTKKINGYYVKDEDARNSITQEMADRESADILRIKKFENIAAMKADETLTIGEHVRTKGYYEAGDAGALDYTIVAAADAGEDDAGSVHVLANGLKAVAIFGDTVSPEMFGAYGDKIHDDTAPVQLAINLANDVKLDKEYAINGSLSLKDRSHLFGVGTIYQPNNIDEKLINIDTVKGIVIEGLTICNESAQSGTPVNYAGQYLVWIENSSDVIIRNCHFKNAYKRGIEVFRSKDIIYANNTFINATFDMLMLFPEVENVVVENSIFDTITSDLAIAYLFATGADDYATTFEFATKNITVNNCKFLNNPKWEGIDTHACVGFTCTNNYVENCYRGCMAKYDVRIKTSSEKKHGDLVIKNNTFIGNNVSTMPAIITGGDATYFAKNILIENNNADSWGASGTNNNAAIDVEHAKYVDIIRNTITNSKGSHLYMVNVTYGNVNENTFLETARNVALLPYVGCWFVNFKNNIIRNLSVNRQNAFNYQGIVNIDGNDIEGFNTPFYGTKTNMVGIVNEYTTQMGKSGNYVRNAYQLPTHYCTDEVVRANKAETLSGFTVAVNGSSNEVTASARYTYDLCEGEEIVISGAGENGGDLTTIISEVIDETHFEIRDAASTGVSNASVSVTASTWVAV